MATNWCFWGPKPSPGTSQTNHSAISRQRVWKSNGDSERGAKSTDIAVVLIEMAKLNGVDPQVWLTVILARITDQMNPYTKRSIVLMSFRTGVMLKPERNMRIVNPKSASQNTRIIVLYATENYLGCD